MQARYPGYKGASIATQNNNKGKHDLVCKNIKQVRGEKLKSG